MSSTYSRDGSAHVTDEKINVYTHLVGAVFALFGASHLVVSASVAARPWHVVAFSIYGMTLLLLFMSSVLHHGVNGSARVKQTLRVMDYAAIYLLIAGTLTPVTMVLIRNAYGWTVFGVSWGIAITGIAFKASNPEHGKGISSTLYLTAGWLTLFTAIPVLRATGWAGMGLLALGGVLYSTGAVIFALEKPNPIPGRFGFHEIWHLMVIAAAAVHYLFMLLYVLPAP